MSAGASGKPKVDFVLDVSTTWTKIPKVEPPRCDICFGVAVWRHPKGGLRCRSCPRPTE